MNEKVIMDLLRCVVLNILFRTTTAEGFAIFENINSWTTASKQCQLAIPDLKFSSDKTTVDLPVNIAIDEEVWVGYYQARTEFEYFGCALKSNDMATYSTKADPGQCMSACGTNKTIGIFENECFCFDYKHKQDNAQTMFPFCNKKCTKPKQILCGGVNAEGRKLYISLYRSIETNSSDAYTNGNDCMNYDLNGFHWDNCTRPYQIICEMNKSVWIANQHASQSYFNWSTATTTCYRNNSRPSSYRNTFSLSTKAQLWTGIVRSQVIFKYTTDTSHSERANAYGYLKNKNGIIEFKMADSTKKKKSICIKGTITTSSSAVAPQSTATSFAPTNSTSTPLTTKTMVVPERSSDVGAIVGATLSIVVIVLIVIGVLLFLRKRGIKLPFLKKEKQATRPNNAPNNNDYVMSRPVKILQSTYKSDQDEYAEIDLTTMIDNEAKNETLNHARESSDYSHDYVVLEKLEKETYDSTKPKDQKSDSNTFNPYNKLSFGESSNYDHVGAGARNAGRKVSDSENTYNTTSLGNSFLKTKVGEPNNAYNIKEDPEDTYNHTNIPRQQLGLRASENDYDAI